MNKEQAKIKKLKFIAEIEKLDRKIQILEVIENQPIDRTNELRRFIGAKLSYYRKQAGMTQLQLSKKIGLSRTSIANIEAGNQEPIIQRLDEMFRLFGAKLWEVLKLADEQLERVNDDGELIK